MVAILCTSVCGHDIDRVGFAIDNGLVGKLVDYLLDHLVVANAGVSLLYSVLYTLYPVLNLPNATHVTQFCSIQYAGHGKHTIRTITDTMTP